MKKLTLFLIVAFALAGFLNAQNPPQNLFVDETGYAIWDPPAGGLESFSDDFEAGVFADGWELVQGSSNYWQISTLYAYEGAYGAYVPWGYTIDTWLITPEIEVGVDHVVSFAWESSYYWSVSPYDNCDLFIQVSTDGGTTWTPIWTFGEIGVWENWVWYETTLDLSAYAGETVLIGFNEVGDDNADVGLDNVYVGPAVNRTIGTYPVSEPAIAAIDAKEVQRLAIRETREERDFLGYNVYLDGGTPPVFVTDTFYQYTGLVNGQTYLAEVTALYDEGESDSIEYEFTYIEGVDPPENLNVECIDNYALFTWDAPGTAGGFNDGFETYDDFVLEFDPWTLVDVDGSSTYSILGYSFPNQNYVGSYIIFNPSQVTPPLEDVVPHSGDKMAACFASASPTYLNDDWMITPAITIANGDEVSFFAKSYTDQYGLERFNVAVSTSGTAPADFTVISSAPYLEAPIEWTEYNYDLSSYAGESVYVAIQCVTADAFIFFVDDFHVGPPADVAYANVPLMNGSAGKGISEYIPGKIVSTDNSRDLLGYNVYLDGDLQTTTPLGIEVFEYQFFGLTNGNFYDAGVSAVYDDPPGESEIIEINFEYTGTGTGDIIVAATELKNNYPNPFNPVTNIVFSIKEAGHVILEVYNIKGEKVRTLINEVLPANNHVVSWNGVDDENKSVASGIYFYKMKAGGRYTSTKKMILMK